MKFFHLFWRFQMTRALPWLALVFSIAALIVSAVRSGSPAASPEVAKSEFYDVRDRLDALEASVSEISTRLDEGGEGTPRLQAQDVFKKPDAAPSPAGRDSNPADKARIASLNREVDALRDQVRDLEAKTKEVAAPDGRNPAFQDAVAVAHTQMRQERMRQHMQRLETARLEAMEEFVQEHGLTPSQSDELRKIISGETEFMRMVTESMDASGFRLNRQEREEKMAGHRENLQGDLLRVLSPEQAKLFESVVMTPPGGAMFPPPPMRRGAGGE